MHSVYQAVGPIHAQSMLAESVVEDSINQKVRLVHKRRQSADKVPKTRVVSFDGFGVVVRSGHARNDFSAESFFASIRYRVG